VNSKNKGGTGAHKGSDGHMTGLEWDGKQRDKYTPIIRLELFQN